MDDAMLARRAAATGRLSPVPGMCVVDPYQDIEGTLIDEGDTWGVHGPTGSIRGRVLRGGLGCMLLVPSKPGSRGALLALARDAWGDPRAFVRPGDHGRWWFVLDSPATDELGAGDVAGEGADEAEALVCALESAP